MCDLADSTDSAPIFQTQHTKYNYFKTGLMDVLNRFAKEMMQETCSQTGFALCCKKQTCLKLGFQIMLISNQFAQPNRFGVTIQFLDQTGSGVKTGLGSLCGSVDSNRFDPLQLGAGIQHFQSNFACRFDSLFPHSSSFTALGVRNAHEADRESLTDLGNL